MKSPTRAPSPGRASVDFEERVDFGRLRRHRLGRARAALGASELGAILAFDVNNIRYITATAIGEWARDKMTRYALLTSGAEPMIWDFGSAARHHREHAPWLRPEDCRSGLLGLRGAIPFEAGLVEAAVTEIKTVLLEHGLADHPVGVDIVEPRFLFEMQRQGLEVRDAQQILLEEREIKSSDEIALLTTAAAMVDGAYQTVADILRPGIRENEVVAAVNRQLYEMGSDDVEAVNAVSGERCNPHPHNFTDRIVRPGDQAFFDIIQAYNGYRTCCYRTFAVGRSTCPQRDAYIKAREWIDVAIAAIRPGVGTDELAALWPAATDFGFPDEMSAFGLQFGHGLGLGLHERPVVSRLHSFEHPQEIKEGMVFAVETYCPATDGFSSARIEEEVVVTATGAEVITLFPAEELFVANPY